MARWPHDDPASLAAFYGDPNKGEPGNQLVPVIPPFQMYYDGKPVKSIRFHKKAAAALKAALDEIWEKCGRDQATVDRYRLSHYSGAYNPRKIRGSTTRWSNHAYGAAIDLDAEHNGFGQGKGTIPQFAVDAFKRQGALWGGDYRGRTDPMHFEFCSRDPVARPVGIMGDVQADGDSDVADVADETVTDEKKESGLWKLLKSKIAWASSTLGGISLGSLSFLQDWRVVLILAVLVFALVALVLYERSKKP